MGILLSAQNLTKSFTAQVLFSNLNFTIEEGERIGLIGPNGAGKSTLLKIMMSQLDPDEGTLARRQLLKVAMLEQSPQFSPKATIHSTILEGLTDDEDWEGHGLAHEYISRFDLSQFGEDAPVARLSGGWQKRVALARELVKRPDLMLLDEPTNHLDVEGIAWLESFLARASFAVLTITHDRLFLQRIANRIIELDRRHAGGILSVRGDYETYLGVREQIILDQENREVVLRNTLRRETEWLRQGAKARTTKQKARIDRALDLRDEVDELATRNQSRTARISFESARRNPKTLIEAKGLTKAFGDKVLFADFNLVLGPGIRIGLLGANGAGKSTLIRTLLGQEKPTEGTVFHSDQLSVAYFDQTREALDPKATVWATVCPKGDQVYYREKFIHVRSYLDRFLFTQVQMNMQVGRLSGGEQSRLLIARLMLNTANVLVLDEPTNDLDIATLNVLEQCLKEFDGALILVTHDRYFLDQVANQIWAFPAVDAADRTLVPFADFRQWETWRANRSEARPDSQGNSKQPAASESTAAPKKKLSLKEKQELTEMEATIHRAEASVAALTHEMSLPENASRATLLADLSKKLSAATADVERLYARWSELDLRAK